jgi:membrane protease YdiL (CAAX protease family)
VKNENLRKGIFCGIFAIFFVGLQPIVANSRPKEIDPFIFAAMMSIVDLIMFLPFVLVERKRLKILSQSEIESNLIVKSLLYGWRKNIMILIFIGLIFSIVPLLLFIGFELAGAINGALASKSEIIFLLRYFWTKSLQFFI